MSITLPVSLGEALDKLSILEIKLERIHDNRRLDVEKEYNLLLEQLNEAKSKYGFWYKHLVSVNKSIWDDQDIVRSERSGMEDKKYVDLCDKILNMNDMRFRIKNKINNIANSNLKEQKGYLLKRAVVYPYLGLGDCINVLGAIRYFSLMYDEVYVILRESNHKNIAYFISDDKSIKLLSHEELRANYHDRPNYEIMKKYTNEIGCQDFYGCAHWSRLMSPYKDVPYNCYRDFEIDKSIYRSFFYVPNVPEQKNLLDLVYEKTNRIVFLHLNGSDRKIIYDKQLKDNVFYCNPDYSMYQNDHPYYELSLKFINLPIIYYKSIIEASEEIYIIDSCFCCYIAQLNYSNAKTKTLFIHMPEINTTTGDRYIGDDILTDFTKIIYNP